MWDHYRKTFARMQLVVLIATSAVYFAMGRRLLMTLAFFAFMQLGSVVGAWWGDRLRRRLKSAFQ